MKTPSLEDRINRLTDKAYENLGKSKLYEDDYEDIAKDFRGKNKQINAEKVPYDVVHKKVSELIGTDNFELKKIDYLTSLTSSWAYFISFNERSNVSIEGYADIKQDKNFLKLPMRIDWDTK